MFIGSGTPFENFVGDQLVGPRVDIEDLNDLLISPDTLATDPCLDLDTDKIQRGKHIPWHIHWGIFDTVYYTGHRVRVRCGIGNVSGAHCLEEGLAFLATDLTHDDVFRTLSHCSPQEFVHVDLPPACRVKRIPCNTRDPVRVRQFYFPRIFKGDDLCHGGDEQRDGIECCGLS